MYTRVTLGVTGIISIWRWAKNATNVSLHGCIFAIKHYFDKSRESQPLLHVLCCKKCSRSFKILQLQRLGINSHTHTHELIAITLRLRARVNKQISGQPSKYIITTEEDMYNNICACSELRDRCFKKAEQAKDSHFSAFIIVNYYCYHHYYFFCQKQYYLQ